MTAINLQKGSRPQPRRVAGLIAVCVLLIIVAILIPREQVTSVPGSRSPAPSGLATADGAPPHMGGPGRTLSSPSSPSVLGSPLTAEEIVAGKVVQFGRSRRELIREIGRRAKTEVPPEVEKFFDAIEAGDWERINSQWDAMAKRSGQYEGSGHAPELDPFWPSVLDAYGVAEQAHLWPAQKLLDYGNAILDSLRPGMVYVGGTDPGRWIPELLNETSGEEPHIIVTQNAFADSRYLEFMNTLYGERFATLTMDDSKRAFDQYVTDARRRLEHDQQFPNEPKQLRPGEDVRLVDNKVQVSGQAAVMAINEKMFQAMLDKNPGVSFAIEQSFPFKSTYASATTLGPVMEVGVQDEQRALTPERAAQSVDYWRAASQQFFDGSEAAGSSEVRLAYAKLASSQASLLLDRKFGSEAEQTFRLATVISPASPEAVFGYANLLADQNRFEEAIPVAQRAIQANPEKQQFRDLLKELQKKANR